MSILFHHYKDLKECISEVKQIEDAVNGKKMELTNRKEGKKSRTWKEEQIAKLEDDLMWHAKSLALRLMVDTASKDKDKSQKSRRILSFLAHDKKFVKLVKDTMHEILSYYGGGKLLEFDKTLHP